MGDYEHGPLHGTARCGRSRGAQMITYLLLSRVEARAIPAWAKPKRIPGPSGNR